MKPIKTIVCPVDFSAGSTGAIDYAMGLAGTLGASVHLLHVYPIGSFVGPDGGLMLTPEVVAELASKSEAALNKLAEPHIAAGRTVEIHVRDGAPAEETVRYAERVGADLVVLGTHGRTGLSRMFLGSVAERIVRTSPIPVLTLRLTDR